VPAVAYGAVQIGRDWVTSPGIFGASPPQLFAMILADQYLPRGVVRPLIGGQAGTASAVSGSVGLAILCAASWLVLALVAAVAIWAARRLRRSVGPSEAYLRIRAVLGFGAGLAMLVAWACLLGWGLSIPAQRPTEAICAALPVGCISFATGVGITAVWWAVVVVTGLAGLRSLVAGNRAMRQLPGLAAATTATA
jgi:hypothetical protein